MDTKASPSMNGSACFLIMPLASHSCTAARKPIKYARLQETPQCSSRRHTTSQYTSLGVVSVDFNIAHLLSKLTEAVCAIYTSDEERAVTIARYLMKDGATTDSHRMFALLSSLCQSPITWYTSGPAQKYILRQIRSIDTDQMAKISSKKGLDGPVNNVGSGEVDLDVCLLMLYGHILFTSTSYTYALGKFSQKRGSFVTEI